jgi:hypothetical protein
MLIKMEFPKLHLEDLLHFVRALHRMDIASCGSEDLVCSV